MALWLPVSPATGFFIAPEANVRHRRGVMQNEEQISFKTVENCGTCESRADPEIAPALDDPALAEWEKEVGMDGK